MSKEAESATHPHRGRPHPAKSQRRHQRSAQGPHRRHAGAEQSYDALKRYSRDLTEAAAAGKLDPVIGRDEEIRRTIQVLVAAHQEQSRC